MLKKAALFIMIGWVWSLAGCEVNPITGQDEFVLYSDQQDIEIGKYYAPIVEKELKGAIDDQALQNYIDGVGRKVSQLSHRPDFDYHFVAVNDKTINALSLPGGYIFITKGMLKKLTCESQLAGVLAHEIVHAVARDTANMMSKQIGMDLLFAAAISQATTEGAVVAADLARQIISLKYSREDEKDADIGGLDYMARAGYDPNGMVETMQMLEKEDTIKPVEFLSSHPSPENRVLYLKARIQSRYQNISSSLKVGQEEYQRFVFERIKNLPDVPEQKP